MHFSLQRPSQRSDEHGLVVVYVAILALVIIGLVGLALDGAFISRTSQQLQHAADAAALNAVRFLKVDSDPFPKARDAAVQVALANEAAKLTVKLDPNDANVDTGDIVVGQWDEAAKTFTPTVTDPNAVRVRAKRNSANADGPLALFFGPVFGKAVSDVGVTATAVLAPPPPPLILILDPVSVGALTINGTNSLKVPAGRVHANSNAKKGINVFGSSSLFAKRTTVVGTAEDKSLITGGPVLDDQDVIADPLAGVLPTAADWNAFKAGLPTPLGPTGKIDGSSPNPYEPGYYPGGLNATSTAAIHLNSGSYMFGTSVKLGGSATVTGNGVTLFLDKNVDLDIAGNGAGMQLTPPGANLPFFGITIFTHRQTPDSTNFKIGGGGVFKAEGVTYVPHGQLVMGGIPGKEMGAIIAWQASTNGTTGFTITGFGIPPLTTEPDVAYLVE